MQIYLISLGTLSSTAELGKSSNSSRRRQLSRVHMSEEQTDSVEQVPLSISRLIPDRKWDSQRSLRPTLPNKRRDLMICITCFDVILVGTLFLPSMNHWPYSMWGLVQGCGQ